MNRMPSKRSDEVFTCRGCDVEKLVTDFYQDLTTKRGHYVYCKVCHNKRCVRWQKENIEKHNASHKKWRTLNRERHNEMSRKWKLENRERHNRNNTAWRHKITRETVDWLLDQGCFICGQIDNPQIDHCHETGAVRGVLCNNHNTGLGRFGDNIEELEKAIAYLRQGNDFRVNTDRSRSLNVLSDIQSTPGPPGVDIDQVSDPR